MQALRLLLQLGLCPVGKCRTMDAWFLRGGFRAIHFAVSVKLGKGYHNDESVWSIFPAKIGETKGGA